jgi:hypothetical protein
MRLCPCCRFAITESQEAGAARGRCNNPQCSAGPIACPDCHLRTGHRRATVGKEPWSGHVRWVSGHLWQAYPAAASAN